MAEEAMNEDNAENDSAERALAHFSRSVSGFLFEHTVPQYP